MRSRPKALQESEGSVPRAAERARCGELHIRAGRARRFRASARLEASPSSHKGALCVAEACERGAGVSRAWKASFRESGITPGHCSLVEQCSFFRVFFTGTMVHIL